MKQASIAILFFFCFAVGLYAVGAHAARLYSTNLPKVNIAPSNQVTIVTLVHTDASYLSSLKLGENCTVLAYIDRHDGNRLKVKLDKGTDTLTDIPLPVLVQGVQPSFTYPDSPKQGDSTMQLNGNLLNIYVTARQPNDPTGEFDVMRLSMPIPQC